MIVLDTNVVSEAMKPTPHPAVRAWLNAQPIETLYLSSVTLAELLFGLAAMPAGRRKAGLEQVLEDLLALFDGRVLAFDADAARCYAELAAKARKKGQGFPMADGYIAAMAATHGYAVASRDPVAYGVAGLQVIDPWVHGEALDR